ncbi:hypothetical protein QYM36_014893 [Artemia franciscana]|uniref:UTP--glucose-1-phosphate uridylyltransferase n=1 Tax=Artemia franciscana TaxID=6661 RepID=A0AA88KZ17_ARTSF|nr:hypothetical protein QYM36_014893 [Artemia franciscana]
MSVETSTLSLVCTNLATVSATFGNSGLLEHLINEGYKYSFTLNIDNIGATVDFNIHNMLLNDQNGSPAEFTMEVTNKTRGDVKGGTLTQYEGKLCLLEITQVPKELVDEFKSIKTFKIFNTNNLWISLDAITQDINENTLEMEVIVNPKTLKMVLMSYSLGQLLMQL